jgi:hypothetical protein
MRKFLTRKILIPILAYCFLDLLALGFGMGIPIFAILMGFLVGWMMPSILAPRGHSIRRALKACLGAAGWTAAFSFLVLFTIWGPTMTMLADPNADFIHFGIPMILYDPTASFIGWIVLMVIISPTLQMLTTAFGSSMRLAWLPPSALSESRKENE